MTGRNLHREAGSGKGVGGGCQTQKRGQREGDRSSFFLEKESLSWFSKNKDVAPTTATGRVRGRAGTAAEMTIQSQDTAEDCTAGSGELGGRAAGTGAVLQAAPECLVPWAARPL